MHNPTDNPKEATVTGENAMQKVLRQFDEQAAQDAKRKETGTTMSAQTKLDAAVKELITKGEAVNTAAAIAALLQTNPALLIAVQEELAAASVGVDPIVNAQQVTKVTKAATDDESAQEQLMAHAREYYISGRVANLSAGVVMASEHYPELTNEALLEGVSINNELGY